jgi:hypothetical protein
MSGNVQSILHGETDNDQAIEGSKMKKRRAQAGAAGEFKADHQNNPAPICLNSSVHASHKSNRLPAWALSAVARSRTGKRPIRLPHISLLDRKGGDDD